MKPLRTLSALLALAAACAPARQPEPEPTPVPAPAPATTPAPTPARPDSAARPATPAPTATPVVREAARDWHLLDREADGVAGISMRRAERELLAGKQPRRTVVVAVLDGGIDTAHADLRANLWTNPKEVAGNRRDDDGNGYADDVRGWNFLGGPDGRSVDHETLEVTRLHVRCRRGGAATPPAPADCAQITADFEKRRTEAQQTLAQIRMIGEALSRATQVLEQAVAPDSLTPARVQALQPANAMQQQAKQMYLQLAANNLTPEVVAEAREEYESQVEYGLNPDFNPRPIVGDDTTDLRQKVYGNPDVMGPDAEHGTHVAGIIGAVRGNEGIDGIAPAVKLMMVRTVPNGDERDKDVANAIRYAVDNGAHIINMSFGKSYSPEKALVDEAARYADSKGVLLVHAAGNDGENLAESPSFPTPYPAAGAGAARVANWIEVGASSWRGLDSLAAPFSNYGNPQVDVFAPGVDILSTVPGGGWERNSGTSMAAPVVSGLAALLMSYYPTLSAADVKRIIVESATRFPDQRVVAPGGGGGVVPFTSLSSTGGIVNAAAAIRMAEERSAPKP